VADRPGGRLSVSPGLLLGLYLALGDTIEALPSFDFTHPTDVQGWAAQHDLAPLQPTSTGLVAQITGSDPYLIGPPRDYPAGTPLWLRLRLVSDTGGSCQVFYYTNTPTEAQSARFSVPSARWAEGRVALPSLGPAYRVRIDPPGTNGVAVLGSLRFEVRTAFPDFDFATVPDATAWGPTHDIAQLVPESDGLRVHISSGDPYLHGPSRDYPAGKPLWLHLRLKSDQGGGAQVFYFTSNPTEDNSVRFTVPAGVWYEAQVPLPALDAGWRLRIDPPGDGGTCLLSRLWFEERVIYPPPAWPAPAAPDLGADPLVVETPGLKVVHSRTAVGGFRVEAGGELAGIGHTRALVGYVVTNQVRWMTLGNAPGGNVSVQPSGSGLGVDATWRDPDGARWDLRQTFVPAKPGMITVDTSMAVDEDRDVLYLPIFTLFAGVGSHGTNKQQALLAGVEYLENEPSSSEADVIGPESWRLVPDTAKLTFPLMALQAGNHYVSLTWEPQTAICAVHDSPDRQFGSGGHLLGLLFPGSDGVNREERSLLPYRPEKLRAGELFRVRATLLGGAGTTVVPAVKHYLGLAPPPPLLVHGYTASGYYELAARGWLESRIRETNLFRHAWWPGFNPQPASDAALWMLWLSQQLGASSLASNLITAADDAIGAVTPSVYNAAQIGHNRFPLPALIFGSVIENAAQAHDHGTALLGRFQPDGSVPYQPPPGGVDYGKTHWAPDANGLTAGVIVSLLEAAVFSGDRALLETGLRHLRALDKFRGTVPRGAQTWEIPLHTPDVLAAAYLVRAHTLGYELTGDRALLDDASYWAWTGVPFVYLTPPVPQPVGVYSTIPVLGATGWQAPVWIGRPVQWCGLVYADALARLAPHDSAAPWQRIADGIAAAGLQHTWPLADAERRGLLPDFYLLRIQRSDGPAINPATLLIPAMRLFAGPAPYTFHAFQHHRLLVHAPGGLADIQERSDGPAFRVETWSPRPCWVLINGLQQTPGVRINGRAVALEAPHQYQSAEGRLALRLERSATVELEYPAVVVLRIQPSASPGLVDLTWPSAASNYLVEWTSALTATPSWNLAPTPVRFESHGWITTWPQNEPSPFFRLRRQEP
jgi:hypothetical protein